MNEGIYKAERIPVLDVIKGCCICFVIVTHYLWTDYQRLLGFFPFWIDMAVPIFMIVSGYVWSGSYFSRGIGQFEEACDFKLIANRVLRYTVPFCIAFFVEVVLCLVVGCNYSIYEWIGIFLTGGVGPGSYYYPVMMQLVFVFTIIFFTLKKSKNAIYWWFAFNAFYELIKTIVGLQQEVYRLSVCRYIFLVSIGVYMYLYGDKIKKLHSIISFFIGVCFILVTRYINGGYNTRIINNDWKGTSFMSAFYIAPIILLIINRWRNLSWKPLALVGKASYNIFLVQMVYYRGADMVYSLIKKRHHQYV